MNYFQLKEGETYEVTPESEKDQVEAITHTAFEILEKGKKVGEMVRNNYFGNTHGNLYGKPIPDISNYGGYEIGLSSEDKLQRFVQSKTGLKFITQAGHADVAEAIAKAYPPPRVIFDDKWQVSQSILGKKPRVTPDFYRQIVPDHVTKTGEILDKELKAGASIEEIGKWAEENLDPCAPCGGGGFDIEKDAVYNDDTEGGHETSYKLRPLPEGLELDVTVGEKVGKTVFPWPAKASQIMAAVLPSFAKDIPYPEKGLISKKSEEKSPLQAFLEAATGKTKVTAKQLADLQKETKGMLDPSGFINRKIYKDLPDADKKTLAPLAKEYAAQIGQQMS